MTMNPNKALWEKGDFTRIAASMRDSGEARTGRSVPAPESEPDPERVLDPRDVPARDRHALRIGGALRLSS
jgi:hypothetical protein